MVHGRVGWHDFDFLDDYGRKCESRQVHSKWNPGICIRYFQLIALGICWCDILGDLKFDLYQLDGLLARAHLIRS